jgi:hypothetical protein
MILTKKPYCLAIMVVLWTNAAIAQNDTTYLTADSNLMVIDSEDFERFRVVDRDKRIVLYFLPPVYGNSKFEQIDSSTYQISLSSYLPIPGIFDWSSYEIMRYRIKIFENKYSFFQLNFDRKYPKLNNTEINEIIENAVNPRTHPLIKNHYPNIPERWRNDAYTRNVGLLTLGILNGSDSCLMLFNTIPDLCTGGEGCQAYYGMQRILAFTGLKLYWRDKNRKTYYLKK